MNQFRFPFRCLRPAFASLLLAIFASPFSIAVPAQEARVAPAAADLVKPEPPKGDAVIITQSLEAATAQLAGFQMAERPDKETVELTRCVFGGDRGYAPASTLAGTRLSVPTPERPRMEVVFVLDTTGSMGGMIEGAKRKIWAVASKLKSAQPTPDIRFGLVAYRDRGDEYVTKLFPLTQDIDGLYRELMALEAQGGGDGPESVNEALAKAINKMKWSRAKDVLRTIFLVGDAPPHTDYARDVQWPQLAKKAKARDILINGLQCGTNLEMVQVWQEIARLTGGASTMIAGNQPTVALATGVDGRIVEINRALNETIIPYGSTAEKSGVSRSRALVEAMSAEGVADRVSYITQTEAGAVTTGRGDLVADLLAGRVTLDRLQPALLDPAWAAKPAADRAREIQQQMERRRGLLAELGRLMAERDRAVEEIRAATTSESEFIQLSPFEVVSDQARAKGFRLGSRKP